MKTQNQIMQKIVSLDETIEQVERELRLNNGNSIYTCKWTVQDGTIMHNLGDVAHEKLKQAKIKYAETFLKIAKAERAVYVQELKRLLGGAA